MTSFLSHGRIKGMASILDLFQAMDSRQGVVDAFG